jgi:hypothetical protein
VQSPASEEEGFLNHALAQLSRIQNKNDTQVCIYLIQIHNRETIEIPKIKPRRHNTAKNNSKNIKYNLKQSNSQEKKERVDISSKSILNSVGPQENANSVRPQDLTSKSSLKSADSQYDRKLSRAKSASVRFYIQPPDGDEYIQKRAQSAVIRILNQNYNESTVDDFPKFERPKSSSTRTFIQFPDDPNQEDTVKSGEGRETTVKIDSNKEPVNASVIGTPFITDPKIDLFEPLLETPKFVRPKSAFTRPSIQILEDESNPIKSSIAELEQTKENIPKIVRAKSAFSRSQVKFTEPQNAEEIPRLVRSQSAFSRFSHETDTTDTLKALRLLEKERLERMKILNKLQRPNLITSEEILSQYTSEYLDKAKQEKYNQFKHARPYYKSRYIYLTRPISYFSFKRLSSTSLGEIKEPQKSFLKIKQLELNVNVPVVKPRLMARRFPGIHGKPKSVSQDDLEIELKESGPIINEDF